MLDGESVIAHNHTMLVYVLKNTRNGKSYVGQTRQKAARRIAAHRRGNQGLIYRSGEASRTKLAQQFDVSASCIGKIVNNETWIEMPSDMSACVL